MSEKYKFVDAKGTYFVSAKDYSSKGARLPCYRFYIVQFVLSNDAFNRHALQACAITANVDEWLRTVFGVGGKQERQKVPGMDAKIIERSIVDAKGSQTKG